MAENSQPDGILLFGGSFNPMHHAHLEMSYIIGQILAVREVLLVPNFQCPHKAESPLLSPQNRFRLMCDELAIFQEQHPPSPHMSVSQVELQKKRPVYTIETIKEIAQIEAHCFLLIGLDQFETFYSWRDYETILTLCQLCVVHRTHASFPPNSRFVRSMSPIEDEYRFMDTHTVRFFKLSIDDRSSTTIRHLIRHHLWTHPWLESYQAQSLTLLKSSFQSSPS